MYAPHLVGFPRTKTVMQPTTVASPKPGKNAEGGYYIERRDRLKESEARTKDKKTVAAVVKPLFIGKIAKSNKEKENEAVKKWVVEIEKESGRVETRLVPARNKCTAISNCKNEGDTVLSCVPYTGQNVKVSGQRDEEEERGYGGYTFGYGFGYGARRKGRKYGSGSYEH